MNKTKKKAMYINLAAQCVLYISVAIFAVTYLTDKELPELLLMIFMVLDLLTLPAFMYAYLKTIEKDKE